jgi:hypothetical protein
MAFPNIPFTSIDLKNNTPTMVTTSLSGKEQRRQVGGQYFTFTGTFSNLDDADRRTLAGFIASVSGSLNTFTCVFPGDISNSTGTYSGTITAVTQSAGQSTFTGTVATSGAAVFKAGDLFKFSSHDKVYMVTADATASGTSLTVSFYPPLRSAVSSATVTHKSVPVTVRLAGDSYGFNLGPDKFSTYSLDFIEVL